MEYTIHVEQFGKIKKADIRVAPLTLFVGDNNSGKSYLLSLVWAFQTWDMHSLMFRGMENIEEYGELSSKIGALINDESMELQISSDEFIVVLNTLLQKNKDNLVKNVFNSDSISIEKLSVSVDRDSTFDIRRVAENAFAIAEKKTDEQDAVKRAKVEISNKTIKDLGVKRIIESILSVILLNGNYNSIYFPAARTGFVLAKDAINKAARKNVFDTTDYDNNRGNIEPFTKPIMNFLDSMNMPVLHDEASISRRKLLDWIQKQMSHGKVDYRDAVSRNIEYYPEGMEGGLPLRTVSAVVTELTPLMILLQYQKNVTSICYEEPEMCLHPQLQLKMAMLLVKLVRSGIDIVATTHSDIMLQHINNACTLNSLGRPKELLTRLDMAEEDCIAVKDVAVYQFEDRGNYSEVRELEATEKGFNVPTFKDALQDILNQTSEIYSFEE